MSWRLLLAVVIGATWTGVAHAQPVQGDVAYVGFRASKTSGTGFVARPGQWVPIQARLTVQGSQLFQGQLKFESADLDGDLVAYRETPVTVTPDAGLKRAWCYGAWLQTPYGMGAAKTLDIISADGVLINRLAVPDLDFISNDTMLLLDISAERLTRLRGVLETPGWRPLEPSYGARPYYHNVVVAAMPAPDLPDRWFGLEAVDVVVWDRPNPAAVSNAQLQALMQWVRAGGQLVVGVGQSWPAVQESALAEIVPLQTRAAGASATVEVDRMPQFFSKLVDPRYQQSEERGARTFHAPISVATAEARPGALRAFRTQAPGGPDLDLITVQWVGSGRVIAVAASLRDLMQVPLTGAFYAQLFDVNQLTEKFLENEGESLQFALNQSTSLYPDVVRPTSFGGWGSLLVLAAFAFVVAYIGVATLASWWWLKRHALVPLSWTVFAVFAVVASALSLGTVGVLRGVQRGVHAFSLVDLQAGQREARARCYFGYRSPIRRRINLSVPGEGSFLRPMTPGPGGSGAYATPQRYSALANRALLADTPMRATLKQFEGFWEGQLDGSIRAALVADQSSGQITPGSWIYNDLDVDLLGGYLLYSDPRIEDDRFRRPAGRTMTWAGRADVPPGLNILAVWVPPIKSGEKVSGLGQELYGLVRPAFERWEQQVVRKLVEMPDLHTLWDEQQIWVESGQSRAALRGLDRRVERRLDETARAVLLACTRGFYLHCREAFDKVNNKPISTDGLMACDVTGWLMQGPVKAPAGQPNDLLQGQAVLLLFADDPGPVRLRGNGQELGPVSGRTLYRVRVPINFEGRLPPVPEGVEP